MKRIKCNACAIASIKDMKHCPECRGVGYIETDTCTAGKNWKNECPISYDPMCDGWECDKCGGSGPL